MTGSDDEVTVIAELVCIVASDLSIAITNYLTVQLRKGASGARGDDTKSLKGAIIDWITPKGQALNPLLLRNMKIDREFNHERTGVLLYPTHLDWSIQGYVLS